MTVVNWHEAFDDAKGVNSAKVLALLYLMLGKDYAYRIAKQFNDVSTGINALKDQSQLQPLLKDLEKRGFLVSEKVKEDGRDRKYFSINPQILCSPNPIEEVYPLPGDGGAISIKRDDVTSFMNELAKKDRKQYLEKWGKIRGTYKYDFVTFLLTVQEEANSANRTGLAQGIQAYISEIQRLERERRRVLTTHLTCTMAMLCDDPMQCSDPDCGLCAASGIKTRWDESTTTP